MRMWMVDPKIMCRQHLLGEHLETHMFVGAINAGKDMSGFVKNELLEIHNLQSRHDALVGEMLARGYKHNTPLAPFHSIILGQIDQQKALAELLGRCPRCSERNNAAVHEVQTNLSESGHRQ